MQVKCKCIRCGKGLSRQDRSRSGKKLPTTCTSCTLSDMFRKPKPIINTRKTQ